MADRISQIVTTTMMNEVTPGLWIGDLPSAMNVEKLKANGIFSILTAMRGRITVNETFIRHQILIDDTEDADILTHLLPSIHFIQAELDKGRGVLVHCQAGVSRSATIVAAYLMYSRNLDPEGALELIRKARPFIDPNANFMEQLKLFHKAHYRVSRKEKDVRLYYLGRTVDEVMNGDGTLPPLDMFANYPRTPSDSAPSTPGGYVPRRRIRCKMCRQELATREHMLDHGQLSPATPAAQTPAASRRPSEVLRRPSIGQSSTARKPSRLSFGGGGIGDTLSMSSIEPAPGVSDGSTTIAEEVEGNLSVTSGNDGKIEANQLTRSNSGAERLKNFRNVSRGLLDSDLSMSAVDDDESEVNPVSPHHISAEAAKLLGRRLSDAIMTPLSEAKDPSGQDSTNGQPPEAQQVTTVAGASSQEQMTTHLISPANLAAQLYSNPKLAGLRTPSFSSSSGSSSNPLLSQIKPQTPVISAPIIINPKCSGYFVEPLKWMEPFLEQSQLSGKILCPNKKCNAKLGNYDWAGVCCGCKEWVVPGFCINRSKVDEIVV